jgi:hypothetical protein
MLVFGIVALVVVVAGVIWAVVVAQRASRDDAAPESKPGDFVAPVSSGGYRFRGADESEAEFKERVARENAEVERASQRPPPQG